MSDLVACYSNREDVIMALLGARRMQRRVSTASRRTESVERVDGSILRKEFIASFCANREAIRISRRRIVTR